LGATVVWLWVFVVGWLNGSPLRLAALLGRGVTHIVGITATVPVWVAVIVFTVLHFICWSGLAALTVLAIRVAARTPPVLLLGAVIAILFQLALFGITLIFANDGLGGFAWPSIFLANIAGLAVTWWYIVRRHPEIRTELARAEDDL
jgi:hypothetical protein